MTKFRNKHGEATAQPDGQIRLSQVVTTFGPGAMVDLLDEAVLITGLDWWEHSKYARSKPIDEARLADYIRRHHFRELDFERPFQTPPIGEDQRATQWHGIPALEFPRWFVCKECHALAVVGAGIERTKSGRREHRCENRKKAGACVPVRFVGACRRGHLTDFPWRWFVHEKGLCAGGTLYLREGKTGDFSQVKIVCDGCDASRRLADAVMKENRQRCSGEQPWLKPGDKPGCGEDLHLLVRTASNGYFPQVLSALEIPEPETELRDLITARWSALENITNETELGYVRKLQPKIMEPLAGFSDTAILETIALVRDGKELDKPPLRTAEHERFTSAPWDLDPKKQHEGFVAQRIAPPPGFGGAVAKVVVAHKLREVRAQIGFTRLEPPVQDAQGDFDLAVELSPLAEQARWLPATELWGEGLFIELDEARVQEWERRPAVIARRDALFHAHKQWVEKNVQARPDGKKHEPAFLSVRFYLLHSLSHLLLSSIALECGYGASAIRERIYCGPSERDKDTPMAAILLSTGTTGSEGTLGGLVEQGARLEHHLRRALQDGALCSNDPVCARHAPADKRSERFLEGAACHGCLFIAESACERFNRYLDRALVVPTMGHDPTLAFFELPE